MDFNEAIEIIAEVLANINSKIEVNKYDGLIVKKLEASNTLDAGRTTKQSHIAITGPQMDLFPYVRADGYFEVEYDKEDTALKKFFVAQIPAYLHKENVDYLGENDGIITQDELVHISIVRSRRNNAADQIQMSMTYMDSPKFIAFRRMVHSGSYLIVLKRKKELMYDLYAVKGVDTTIGKYSLNDLNNCFYKSATNTTVKLDEIVVQKDETEKDDLSGEILNHNLFGIHIQGKNDALSVTNPHICIGWSDMGDITDIESYDDLGKLYDQYFHKTAKGRGQDLGQIWRFRHDMKVGDYVIYSESDCFHIGKIVSDYIYNDVEYDAQDPDYKSERKVEWLKTNIDRTILSKTFNSSLKAGMSLWTLNDYKSAVVDILNENYVKDEDVIVEENRKSMSCLDVTREPRTNKVHPLNFIVYGAPGTGKTYSMVEYALSIIDGVSIDDFRKSNTDRKTNVSRYKELVKAGQIVFTTFHQNYGYEEFIQGLRPDKNSETMAFKTVDGVFKVIADTALNDTENKNYVIIIDEINRANISKVFGELITLIEEDKRWGELNETSATLQSGDQFAVPNNLYIVGTMNSADKSISLIDAALRRRFDFIEQKPDSALVPEGVLRKMFDNINENLVSELDSTDLLVGHSYFMKKTEKDLCNILNNNIIPLLYEYFYDNRKKVAKLLKDAIDKSGAQIEIVDEKVGRLRVKDKVE